MQISIQYITCPKEKPLFTRFEGYIHDSKYRPLYRFGRYPGAINGW
jgi:hypothetical protein